jgi:D-alanyl-lipoteichoic acid acyltransferase DltB (MBOAT superfamily)
LPLAISFFTFEMISVLIDAYRGDVRVGSFLPFAAYKAYFPKLLSGPITRFSELGPQLIRPAPLTVDRFLSGLALFTYGLAKKLAISNNLSSLSNPVFDNPGAADSAAAIAAVLAFGLQIYFDFSAYTDMARGASRLFGLELPRNFDFPYAATSPSEFWRRWHMSLSRWLRDYLYIPLGGNRKGNVLTYRNLLLTMILGGLWHGAAWHFALWGALHGVFLAISHALRGRIARPAFPLRALGWVTTMAGVFCAWIFFRASSVADGLEVLKAFGRAGDFSSAAPLTFGVSYGAVTAGMALFLVANPLLPRIAAAFRHEANTRPLRRHLALGAAVVLFWTAAGLFAAPVNPPFIYFRF